MQSHVNEPGQAAENLRGALLSLQERTRTLRGLVDRLAEAEPVLGEEAEQALHEARQAAEVMRARLGDGLALLDLIGRLPAGRSEASLEHRVVELIRSLEELASVLPRVRVDHLASELRRGRINPLLPSINRRARERARDSAVSELSAALARPEEAIESFPGPDEPGVSWLGWFWSLAAEAEHVLEELLQTWPELTKFLENVTSQEWESGASQVETTPEPDLVAPEPHRPAPELPQPEPQLHQPAPEPNQPAPPSPPNTVSHVRGEPTGTTVPPIASNSAGVAPSASSPPSDRRPAQGKVRPTGPARLDHPPGPTPVRPSHPLKAAGPTSFLPLSPTTRIATEMREPPRREESGSPRTEYTPPTTDILAPEPRVSAPSVLDALPRSTAASTVVPHAQPAPLVELPEAYSGGTVPAKQEPSAPPFTPLPRSSAKQQEPSVPRPSVVEPPPVASPASGNGGASAISAVQSWPEKSAWLHQHWVDPERHVVPGPWLGPGFGEELGIAQFAALRSERWGEALVLGAADEPSDEPLDSARLSEHDVNDLLHFARGSLPRNPARDDLLESWIQHEAGELRLRGSVANRLRFGLAAFNPSVSARIAPDRWSDACELLEYSSSFKVLLGEWHQFTRTATDPYLLLRRQLNNGDSATTIDALQLQLTAALGELRAAIRRYSHAGGGAVQRTHCRDAWDAFMQVALPVLKTIAESRALEDETYALGRLPGQAKRIFDKHGAKYHDRKQMDKLVQELCDFAFAVIELHQHLQIRQEGTDQEHRLLDEAALHLWLEADALDLLDEERLLLDLTRPVLRGQKESVATVISSEELRRRPWLLAAWASGTCQEARGIAAEDCEHPLIAAASLLWPPLPGPVDDLRAWLSEYRPLLLARIADPKEPLRGRILRAQEELRDQVSSKVAEVRVLQHRLDSLADQSARRLDDTLRDAENALREYAGEDLTLILHWIERIREDAEGREEQVVLNLRQNALQEGMSEVEFRELSTERRYSDLLRRIGTHQVSSHVHHRRATPFRGDAANRYNNPRYALQKADGFGPKVKSLIDAWFRAGVNTAQPIEPAHEDNLRALFCDAVFESEGKKRKTKVRALSRTREHRIDAQSLRERLEHETEKPNFFPQITRINEIRILNVPGPVGDRSLPSRIAGQGETGMLTILLAPGLSAERRAECRVKIRDADSARPVALIDDLDLCRLLNPRGQQPVLIEGLMEIALEQQRWSAFTPYEVQEGQHVKMEMYVGRNDEANRLATSTAYSRIFSGRRLGKTALLRFVEHTKQEYKLPSGNVLHVLYVPIVGFQNEFALVDEILTSVYRHIDLDDPLPDQGEPGDRLERGLEIVLRKHPTVSLLVFLDEADTFFEGQLDGPAGEPAQHERALSWRMRKLEGTRDIPGLPRIRFLFCGYRQTNRSEGAWANWGDVLQLRPLDPEDAVSLVVGPLARIGIDAQEQADAIAFRCGYQPALVIRFCVQLVEYLERARPVHSRDEVKVTHRDVAIVLNTPEVQNAIREVTWLNFVGNPGGQLIFASLLKELGERPPGSSIEDAPGQLLEQISKVTDPSHLSNIGGTNWTDFAVRHLRELVARSLLSESGRNPLSVRLHFPHHLPTLLQDDPTSRIKSALELLSSASAARGGGRWLLSDDILANVRWNRGAEARELGVQGLVVGGSWVDPLLDSSQGLGFHLGQDGNAMKSEVVPSDEWTFRQARLEPDREGVQIFVGGADLLREALRTAEGQEEIFEVVPIGRLTMSGVQAWFQKSRGVEFSESDALQRIMALTGGIPLLVKLLDDSVMSMFERGATLERSDLDAVLRQVQNGMKQVVQDLLMGPAETKLEAREIELLRLLCAVAQQHTSWEDFQTCATDRGLWDGELLKLGLEPVDLVDRTHISVLLALGWLPRRFEGTTSGLESVGVPGRQDPLFQIADLLAR